ncbi:hypothetical protein [Mucilaginibacter sp.]|nr:hypothetical protein [Mucilaginibacter sp.]MDB5129723.1 hypothetical protein [Mucilaginibacter sp.]
MDVRNWLDEEFEPEELLLSERDISKDIELLIDKRANLGNKPS